MQHGPLQSTPNAVCAWLMLQTKPENFIQHSQAMWAPSERLSSGRSYGQWLGPQAMCPPSANVEPGSIKAHGHWGKLEKA